MGIPIERLPGVGKSRANKLRALGISSLEALLWHLPRRYEDRSRICPIAELKHGEWQLVQGVVQDHELRSPRRGLKLLTAVIRDETGWMRAVWFNQPHVQRKLRLGEKVRIYGKVEFAYGRWQMVHGEIEEDLEIGDERDPILPVYPLVDGLRQKQMREWVRAALSTITVSEFIPASIRDKHHLLERNLALRAVHFPRSWAEWRRARRSLAFEELFLLQCYILAMGRAWGERPGIQHRPGHLCPRFLSQLPFELTNDQKKAWRDIEVDMAQARPMHRLVQGDVGSGKTVIAALAMLRAAENRYQAALMAPTEVLAEQHYAKLLPFTFPLGIRVGLLRGSMPRSERERLLRQIKSGEIQWVIGTHALLQDDVRWHRLSLVVTDEQHRFGVTQRQALLEKGTKHGEVPDMLIMTATPIPRTLALTLFGDLDVSIIKERPPGRKPVDTRVLGMEKRAQVYEFVRKELAKGRQAYIICARVGGADDTDREKEVEEQPDDVKAATAVYEELVRILQPYRVGLLHGKLKAEDKANVMSAFSAGHLQALVATTVVEVGIDVPNASVIVIENAERYGLAQLHQLRGRVGRGVHDSYCLLLASPSNELAAQRLKAFRATEDGFAIAEADLRLRGMGEFFGEKQHGLPDLKIADPVKDQRLLMLARQAANELLVQDPFLESPEHLALKRKLEEVYPENKLFVG